MQRQSGQVTEAEGTSPHVPAAKYKRLYQACDSCKERKIRCDLGPVDAPTRPPCKRCRRENKSCTFFSMRRKRKAVNISGDRHVSVDPTGVENPRKRNNQQHTASVGDTGETAAIISDDEFHWDSDASINRQTQGSKDIEDTCLLSNSKQLAARLLKRPAATSYDTISILHAAGRQSEKPVAPMLINRNRHGGVDSAERVAKSKSALEAWSRFRFVLTGLISVHEAISLVDYFFEHLVPFTPVISSFYADSAHHTQLLENEPILAVTILMIASRFMAFIGPGAAVRSYTVHNTLWEQLQKMITHMIWGQENFLGIFDGELCSDSAHRACPSLGGLRTLGTCQALLLLTEWNPRVIHFPPAEEEFAILSQAPGRNTSSRRAPPSTPVDRKVQDAAWRSDRLIWSMLGNAFTLATELGIYDDLDGTTLSTREARGEVWHDVLYQKRANRVHHILLVYLAQTSARLGRSHLSSYAFAELSFQSIEDDTIRCWRGVTVQMQHSNSKLFRSRTYTRQIIQNQEYKNLLDDIQASLHDWKRDFDMAKLAKSMRAVLLIEFGYIQVCSNSIAIQALTERYERIAKEVRPDAQAASLLSVYRENESYIKEVAVAAKKVLLVVVDELFLDDHLKYIPNRTYYRILTCAVAIWKTFAVAVRGEDIVSTLHLLDRTAKALQTSVVDDIHLANHFGNFLDSMVQSLKNRRTATAVAVVTTGASSTRVESNYHYDTHGYVSELVRDAARKSASKEKRSLHHHQQREYINNNDSKKATENFRGATAGVKISMQTPYSCDSNNNEYGNNEEPNNPATAIAASGSVETQETLQPEVWLYDQSTSQLDPWLPDVGAFVGDVGQSQSQMGWFADQDMFNMLGPLLDECPEF